MSRTCRECGKPLEGQTRKLYCDSSCRARASEKRRRSTSPAPPKAEVGPVEKLTAEEVDEASPLGAAAIVLARRIDQARDSGESGSSVASMVRELRATMVEALPAKPVQRDEVDELRERRAQRLGRAVG